MVPGAGGRGDGRPQGVWLVRFFLQESLTMSYIEYAPIIDTALMIALAVILFFVVRQGATSNKSSQH